MSYEFGLEMAWKSAAISGAALLLVALLRSRSAADRGAVLRLGVLFLLSLPAVALLFPALVVETAAPAAAAGAAPAAQAAPVLLGEAELGSAETMAAMSAAEAAAGDWNDPGALFLLLYLGGVAMVGARLLAGIVTLRRWTREAREVTDPVWTGALARVGTSGRHVRLLVSDEADSPLSWGWRKPVILLDRDALHRPEDADAILAHEAAHIVRRDWLSLMLSRVSVALFWFNPLVWRLDREIAQQAEEAADSHAAEKVEPALYAQTLLDWARQSRQTVPANAMAGFEPGLSRRVKALLDGRFRRPSGSFWSFAAMAACVAVAAPVAALEFVPRAPEAATPPAPPPAPAAAPAVLAAAVPAAPPAPGAPSASPAPAGVAAPAVPAAPAAPAAPPAPPAPARIATLAALAASAHHRHGPYVRPPVIDERAIAAEVEAAVDQALRSAHVARAQAHAHARVDEVQLEAQIRRSVAHGLAEGARGMHDGARGMEEGARGMEATAEKLRSREYREREIAKAAAKGDRVSHDDLIRLSDELREGAREMRQGAKEMREGAREMRRGG